MTSEPCDSARRSERRPVRKAAVLLFEAAGESRSDKAYTVDVSEHGMRLKTHSLLDPGQIIEFQSEDQADFIRCRVVWSGDVASDGEGEAGLEFFLPVSD